MSRSLKRTAVPTLTGNDRTRLLSDWSKWRSSTCRYPVPEYVSSPKLSSRSRWVLGIIWRQPLSKVASTSEIHTVMTGIRVRVRPVRLVLVPGHRAGRDAWHFRAHVVDGVRVDLGSDQALDRVKDLRIAHQHEVARKPVAPATSVREELLLAEAVEETRESCAEGFVDQRVGNQAGRRGGQRPSGRPSASSRRAPGPGPRRRGRSGSTR